MPEKMLSPRKLPEGLLLLSETALDAVVVIDTEGAVLGWNRVAEQIFGWSETEALGRSMTDMIVPEQHRFAHQQGMKRYHRTGEARVLNRRIEISAINKDGHEFPVELSITKASTAEGTVFVGYLRDITARREAEAAFEEARSDAAKLAADQKAILSQLAEAVIVADQEGRITFVNEAARRLHGVDQLGVAPEEYSDAYHLLTEDGRPYPPYELPLARSVRGEQVLDSRWRIARPDGTEVLAVGSAQPLLDRSGNQTGAVLTARDETERVRAEQQVRENEARLRALTGNLPNGAVYQIRTGPDGDGREFLYLSQSYERLSGVPVDEVLSDPSVAYNAVHPDDRQKLIDAEREAIQSKKPFDVQARFCRRDGQVLWCRFISAPREQADGSLIWDGLQIDATARITAELALRELNEHLEQRVAQQTAERNRVWEMSRDLLAIIGFDGQLKAINPAWEKTLGRDSETLLSLSFREQVHPDDHEAVQGMMQRLLKGESVSRFEDRLRHADGSWRWIAWTLVPEGDVFYAVGRDVTAEKKAAAELEQAQEALRQSQKMEAMGQLTGGVAHDFNNLLTPIVGSLDLLQRRGVGGEREQRLIAGAAQSAERAKTLVQRLLAFARRQPLQPVPVDIGELLGGLSDLLSSTMGPQIRLVVEINGGVPPAKADPNQLEMALLNLAVNARDAMPDGGTLRITAVADEVGERNSTGMRPGRYVRLSVADTGMGMDEGTLARAIEPFFSTKGIGKGTGLGLSMAHGLASQLGGALKIATRLGVGTNIDMWLPATASTGNEREEAKPLDMTSTAGVALLVDDEELVRMSTAEMLHDLGYEVVEATSAEEALRLVESGLVPDLLVTDHLMPGLNGTDLARRLLSQRRDMQVLIVSGYAETDGVAPDLPRLAKPFRNEDLARSLATLGK